MLDVNIQLVINVCWCDRQILTDIQKQLINKSIECIVMLGGARELKWKSKALKGFLFIVS